MLAKFSIYDVYAHLIPGIVTIELGLVTWHIFTEGQLLGVSELPEALLLIVPGYWLGIFLQVIGKLLVYPLWLRIRGGYPTATMLSTSSRAFTSNYKRRLLDALGFPDQAIPRRSDVGMLRKIQERTYEIYKGAEERDPTTLRFLAEHHGARAYVTAFILLSVYAATLAVTQGLSGAGDDKNNLTLIVLVMYPLLAFLSIWLLENKGKSFARHILVRFAAEQRKNT